MSIRSGLTVSLVEEARKGPFVYHGDLRAACEAADRLDIDAIEVFPGSPDDLEAAGLRGLLDEFALNLAAVGTGAGWLKHKMSLSDRDSTKRAKAVEFVHRMIDAANAHAAPVIIGSMQGRSEAGEDRSETMLRLTESLRAIDDHAAKRKACVLIEPLNRYETNLLNTLSDGKNIIMKSGATHTRVLGRPVSYGDRGGRHGRRRSATAARDWATCISPTRTAAPPAWATRHFAPVIEALVAIEYKGVMSAEVFPLPDSYSAAKAIAETFRRLMLSAPASGMSSTRLRL